MHFERENGADNSKNAININIADSREGNFGISADIIAFTIDVIGTVSLSMAADSDEDICESEKNIADHAANSKNPDNAKKNMAFGRTNNSQPVEKCARSAADAAASADISRIAAR